MAETKADAEQDPSIEDILQSIRQIISEDDDGDDASSDTQEKASTVDNLGGEVNLSPETEITDKGADLDLNPADEDKDTVGFEISERNPDAMGPIEDDVFDLTEQVGSAEGEETPNMTPEKDNNDDWQQDSAADIDIVMDEMVEDKASAEDEFKAEDKDIAQPSAEATSNPDKEPAGEAAGAVSSSEDDMNALLSEKTENAAYEALGKLAVNMPVERGDHPAGITLEDITREMLRPMLKTWLDENLPNVIERLVQKEIQKITRRFDDES